MDNIAITMVFTGHNVFPIQQCRKYSRPDQMYIEIPHPAVVEHYIVTIGLILGGLIQQNDCSIPKL